MRCYTNSTLAMAMTTPTEVICMSCSDKTCDFKPKQLYRRALKGEDIEIQVHFCGVCHSDMHTAAGHMEGVYGKVEYPHVPGHELSGRITRMGKDVKGFKIGDAVGVGYFCDSCLKCAECLSGNEHKCFKGLTTTYAAYDKHGRAETFPAGHQTLGGYTNIMIVHYKFAVTVPQGYPLQMAGPIMCSGVTMYSPMCENGVRSGSKVGIVGLGGLGQMGIRIAKAMGAIVTVISRTDKKRDLALKCGADAYISSTDPAHMVGKKYDLDLILNTIPGYHAYIDYQMLLSTTGIQVLLGAHAGTGAAKPLNRIVRDKSRIKMSTVGSIKMTQDVMNLCAENKIYPEVSVVPVSELNNVFSELDKSNESGLRYVLDIAGSLSLEARCANPPVLRDDEQGLTVLNIVRELAWLLWTGKYK